MTSLDLFHDVKPEVAFTTQVIATDTTTVGAIIDALGYESITFLLQSGTVTDGTYVPAIYAGDASDMSDEAVVTADFLLGTIATASFAAADDNAAKWIGAIACKRYFRIKIVSATTTSGATLSGLALLGHPLTAPTSAV